MKLPTYGATVICMGTCAEIWSELGVTPPWIDFFLAVVWRTVGVLPSRLWEGSDFIHAVAGTDDGALDAFDEEISSGGIGTVTAVGALPDTEGLGETVHDVTKTTAELAAPIVVMAGRRLNVCHDSSAQRAEREDGKDDTIFHADL